MAKFKKGQSGNPKGRPKGTTSIANLIKKIGAENISAKSEHDKLEFIMRKVFDFAVQGESWAVHFIADRLEGKPRQVVGIQDVSDEPIKVFDFDEVEN
tara:strand:+ start:1741 stop:2034 length:294 start_codon:yes stop_codon:yes gene_type:complete